MRTQSTMSIARKWVMMRKALQELRYKCGRHNTDSAIPDMTEDQSRLGPRELYQFWFLLRLQSGQYSSSPRRYLHTWLRNNSFTRGEYRDFAAE